MHSTQGVSFPSVRRDLSPPSDIEGGNRSEQIMLFLPMYSASEPDTRFGLGKSSSDLACAPVQF